MSSVEQPVGPDPTALQDLRWVGKSVPRKEDPKLLTGRAQYVGDVTVTGCSTARSCAARTPTRGSARSTPRARRRSPASSRSSPAPTRPS